MPELPEVETVARLLRPRLVGRTLRGARILWPRTLVGTTPAALARAVRGATVAGVGRRAKFVVLDLERAGASAGHLIVHLRMTGRLHVESAAAAADPWLRAAFALDGGERLVFNDVRKFGRIWFVRDPARLFAELGPEPLADEFTPERLHALLRSRKRVLKPLLLDQTFVAGLGNIYVDESLFAARLHPRERSDRVGAEGSRALCAAIRRTLARAIEREGSSFDVFYRTPEGNPGSFQDEFQVYGRGGEPCRRCGAPVVRTLVGQRGTHFCPACQPRIRGASARASRARRSAATAARTSRDKR